MDLRTERTKKCIINAFIELRAKKPLEKITVKELSESALIHKATFYNHYQDIYDLSEQLENEVIEMVLNNIAHLECIITSPKQTTKELVSAIDSQSELVNILFSGSRQSILIQKLNAGLKEHFYKLFPQYKSNLEFEVALSVLNLGSFYTISNCNKKDHSTIIEILGNISETLMEKFRWYSI